MATVLTEDEIKLCNCANCGKELLGRSLLSWYEEQSLAVQRKYPPMCAGYIDLRPYCAFCFRTHRRWYPATVVTNTNVTLRPSSGLIEEN